MTNAPGSGGPGAGIKVPNGTYSVTPIEAVNNHVLTGTATSVIISGSGVSIPDTFNPAESMVASASASGASLIQLTNPATVGITPTLHS